MEQLYKRRGMLRFIPNIWVRLEWKYLQGLGRSVSPENCGGMQKSKVNWLTASSAIVKIQQELLKKESRKKCLKANPSREVIPNDGPAG